MLTLALTSNFASQPETDITGTEWVEADVFILHQVMSPAKPYHAFSLKSLREVLVKHDLILSIISLCQKVILIFENRLKLSQKNIVMKLNSNSLVDLTHSL